ncbi:MAG: murein biosynthesis integral membrane protein MurJ [Candidatus Fischerbacteria bacterium RBG_13_37_8]|uniref:Probable lipid II flippase MurJ n=1 Tax=Candidatus Fischerbacteria bacterium RBG_13_37_8 TaxID=1817863 RepID=A0A1F5VJC3_9BACT|nr:MAG: murein biosynthesis integral membrane protein MurJ [Candidatus Fischerbacteria bacterium RBG_13_37_8]
MNKIISTKILHSARIVSLMTLLSRIAGYFRDRCMSVYLGTGLEADAFTIAFLIPNVLRRLFGEGSMTAAFLPTFSDFLQKEKNEETWHFARIFFWNLMLIITFTALLGIVFSPFIVNLIAPGYKNIEGKIDLTISLNRLIFPFIILISLSALEMAILNALNIFGLPASTPIFFNLSVISSALLLQRFFSHPSYAFAFGVLAGGFVQFAIQIPKLARSGMKFLPKFNFSHPAFRKVALLMVPGFFAIGIAQINIYIGQYYASHLAEGSVASIYYADRVMELALGVYGIAIFTVVLPMLSRYASLNNIDDFKETLLTSFRLIIIITIPAATGLIFLRYPIIEVLFQQGKFSSSSTELTCIALFYFSFGLPGFALVKIIVSAFYSFKDTLTPVLVGCISIATNLLFINLFIASLLHGSIALASSMSAYINFLLLLFIFIKRKGHLSFSPFLRSFIKIIFASFIMGLLSYFLTIHFWLPTMSLAKKVLFLFSFILLDIGCYGGLLYIIAREELTEFMQFFTRKKQ